MKSREYEIGPDDRARGAVQLKHLGSHDQQSVARADLVGAVTSLLSH